MCTSAFIDGALLYPESFQFFLWHCRDGRVLTRWQQKVPTLTFALRAVFREHKRMHEILFATFEQCPRSSSRLFHCRLE